MSWSTRELAELAGVSVRAIRHWHDLGLLPEPDRRANGYKQYVGQHLVLVLRIKRLTGLGFTLDRVGELLDSTPAGAAAADPGIPAGPSTHADARAADDTGGPAQLMALRGELDARIAELQRVRADVDALLREGGPLDLTPAAALVYAALAGGSGPTDSAPATGAIQDRDATAQRASRDIAIVLGHLAPNRQVTAIAEVVAGIPHQLRRLDRDVMRLPADASAAEIAGLADDVAAAMRSFIADSSDHAALAELDAHSTLDASLVTEFAFEGLNAAQRQVMTRVLAALTDPA